MKNEIIDFYTTVLGHKPYDYQTKVAETLLNGKNVILSVPTGAGKTWASIVPFLIAKNRPEIHFPSKLIYSLPLRALTNSIYEDVFEVLIKNGYPEDKIERQTGEYSNDKYFEKDFIFSTIDQTLSNFLCFPLPLSERLANINAGALIGSYLVFDEFHLLDKDRSMATTIGSLKILGNLCRCCIMTATLSNEDMKALKEHLTNYEIITLDEFPDDKNQISSLLPKLNKKLLTVVNKKITAEDIFNKHKTKSIVICNRVETAQNIYNDLVSKIKSSEDIPDFKVENIICLHSRFFDKDRKDKESQLKKLFGKFSIKNEHAILIATQVIEAGMDISCEVMHTEISPINSFLQRAGRCARFKNETGEVFIYDVLEVEESEKILLKPESAEDKNEIRKLNNRYLPYEPSICQGTFLELQNYKSLDGDIPKKLIEKILQAKSDINQLKLGNYNHNKILDSWSDCKKNNYRNTIRDIQSVEITIINDEQCDEVAKFPYRFQSLGMYKFSLMSWLNKITKADNFDSEDWLVKKIEDSAFIAEIDNDEDIKFQLTKISDFKTIPPQVYVNAKYFGYENTFGLNWQYPKTFNHTSPKREWKTIKDEPKSLKKDTFYQHNKALIGAFETEFLGKNKNKLDFVFKELAVFIGREDLKKEDFIRLINLMILLHDYGKLNIKWQKPLQHYQALKEGIAPRSFTEILGHSDYDEKSENDKKFYSESKMNTRPAHAGVGAYVAQEILPSIYDNEYITSCIPKAIARHHSPLSLSFPDFKISNTNYLEIQKLLTEFNLEVELEQEGLNDKIERFAFDDWEKEQIIYLFFVRILRLCDQKATEDFNKYFKEQNYV